jgi:hypothetical protein
MCSAPEFKGAARIVNAFGLTMFDQPTFGESWLFAAGSPETWRATSRGSSTSRAHQQVIPAMTNGKQGPPRWANAQIAADKFTPVRVIADP